MTPVLFPPFFEIGPKNFLRRPQLELLARAAGDAAAEAGVAVVITVPTALIGPLADLHCGVLIFAQTMDANSSGSAMGVVSAESLVDAGADGVMLNHDGNPLGFGRLARSVEQARSLGLETIVCAASEEDAVRFAALEPTAVLFEPPELIGTAGDAARPWIKPADAAVRSRHPGVLMMHAGGVATPEIARSIMAAGADGTGSTSGILGSDRPIAAVREFIVAARRGWDGAHASSPRK